MPSYDLSCQDCGQKFSVFCAISKKDEQVCPQCGSGNLSQRFTALNVVRNVGASDRNPFAGTCDRGSCASGSCPSPCDFSNLV
jgi:putative FmdB family regulatory protein